jgi:hypothetical protein
VAYLSFFRHIAKLSLDYSKWHHYEVATEAGPRIMHSEFCIVSERPEVLKVDSENRPHCDDGPFCRWRDGSAIYAVHGVRVPWDIIEHPKSITIARIEAEQNAEIRRVMIDKYGASRYLLDSGAKELHRDQFGILYRKDLPGDEPMVMVRVVNSTPEPDGHSKEYWLRVHPALRPMLRGQQLGEPQKMTARAAVASTFGLRAEEYAPEVET